MGDNAKVRQFVSWLESKIDTEGSVALVASFLLRETKKFVTQKALQQDSIDGFVAVVCGRMGKARKPFVMAALYDGFAEFERGLASGEPVIKRMRVEPALKRVQKAVKTIHERGETEGVEDIEVAPLETHPAYVDYKVGYTTNLGSYESARVSVGISLPCYPEEVDKAVAFLRDYVDHEVAVQIGRYRGEPVVPSEPKRELLTEAEEKEAEQQAKVLSGDADDVTDEDVEEQDDEQDVSWESEEVKGDLGF